MIRSSEGNSTPSILRDSLESRGGHARRLKIESLAGAKKTLTICPYCSVGCGIIVHSVDNKIVNVEGDPANPVNEGALCAKGAATHQLVHNPERLMKPKYRAPNATEWQEVEWDWVLDKIARRVKATRDRTFHLTSKSRVKETGPDGKEREAEKEFVINMTDGVGHIFGSLADGPFPEHYEPLESPLPQNPLSSQRINPAAKVHYTRKSGLPEDTFCSGDDRYPIVCTTIRTQEQPDQRPGGKPGWPKCSRKYSWR